MTLVPAYGRDYKSAQAVLDDWNADKDFIDTESGRYVNKTDADTFAPAATIKIRYHKLTRALILGD